MTNPLTIQEALALKGRELDAAVAEWMGYKNVQHDCYTPVGKETCGNHPLGIGGFDGNGRIVIPNYSKSTSDMYEVEEEIQKRGLTEPYIEMLSQIISSQSRTTIDFLWRMAHATPEQRARAVVLMAQETAAQDRLRHQMSDHGTGARGGE